MVGVGVDGWLVGWLVVGCARLKIPLISTGAACSLLSPKISIKTSEAAGQLLRSQLASLY